jgi:hypothetical protein
LIPETATPAATPLPEPVPDPVSPVGVDGFLTGLILLVLLVLRRR